MARDADAEIVELAKLGIAMSAETELAFRAVLAAQDEAAPEPPKRATMQKKSPNRR